jgi:ionotropic glutamate receptor NMDA 2B
VLEYLVGQDSECVLLTVGSWFAMTGYGVGFPRHSKFRDLVNQQLMEYRENGKSVKNVIEIRGEISKSKQIDV